MQSSAKTMALVVLKGKPLNNSRSFHVNPSGSESVNVDFVVLDKKGTRNA